MSTAYPIPGVTGPNWGQQLLDAIHADIAGVVVPTDEQIAGRINDPASATTTALSAAIAGNLTHVSYVEKGTLTDSAKARPDWPGIVDWWIPEGGTLPLNVADGDLITEVSETPIPWAPTDLAGLMAWFSPRDSGIADGSGASSTVPNMVPGASAYAVTGSPTYDADGLNGHPCFAFDGNDYLRAEALSPSTGSGPYARIFVGQLTTTAATSVFCDGTTLGCDIYASVATTKWSMRRGGGTAIASSGSIDTDPHVFVAVYDGPSSYLEIDGTVVGTGTPNSPEAVNADTLGARPDGSGKLNGKVGDSLLIRGTLSSGEKADAVAWIKARHGIA